MILSVRYRVTGAIGSNTVVVKMGVPPATVASTSSTQQAHTDTENERYWALETMGDVSLSSPQTHHSTDCRRHSSSSGAQKSIMGDESVHVYRLHTAQ